jgi:signal peptidase II
MAFGWMFPGTSGKLALSIFRIIVVTAIIIYIYKLTKKKTHQGYMFCLALIVAGALGNIIDSAVYGMCFDKGSTFDPHFQDYIAYSDTAAFSSEGYAPFLMGNVVDMIHLTKEFDFPSWSPIHAGERAEIFPPIFNIADASISVGIILILLFQRRFFKEEEEEVLIEEAVTEVNTSA